MRNRQLGPALFLRNIGCQRASVRLETTMWDALDDIANRKGLSLRALLAEIEHNRTINNRSAAIRIYVVEFYRALAGKGGRPVAAVPAAELHRS